MTECRKAFIDTAPFIYCIEESENNPQYFEKIKEFFESCYNNYIPLVSSTITIEEYCVMPYRKREKERITLFKNFMKSMEMEIFPIDEAIADKAAQIRAEYKHFKPMDALQLASACLTGCDLFLTNDKQLRQFTEIKVVTVDELGNS